MKLENYILSELFPIDRMRNVGFFLNIEKTTTKNKTKQQQQKTQYN
jgi:adenylate cyclase class IV